MLLAQGRDFKDVIQRLMQSGATFEALRIEESDSDDDMVSLLYNQRKLLTTEIMISFQYSFLVTI